MAYVGSQANFEAVAPSRVYGNRGNRFGPPHVVTKQELMQDPIYGKDHSMDYLGEHYVIRSLVKKKRDLYIYHGSPVSVQLMAPLKVGFGSTKSEASVLNQSPPASGSSPDGGYRRFSPEGSAPGPNQGSVPGPNQGSALGLNQGSTPGPNQGSAPGHNQGSIPGSNQGSLQPSTFAQPGINGAHQEAPQPPAAAPAFIPSPLPFQVPSSKAAPGQTNQQGSNF
jgi:hypothetical protein